MSENTTSVTEAIDSDLGFTFRLKKSGEVEVLRRGRLASTLRGTDALDFIAEVESDEFADGQQLMARVTATSKHVNERTASNHPRNRRSPPSFSPRAGIQNGCHRCCRKLPCSVYYCGSRAFAEDDAKK